MYRLENWAAKALMENADELELAIWQNTGMYVPNEVAVGYGSPSWTGYGAVPPLVPQINPYEAPTARPYLVPNQVPTPTPSISQLEPMLVPTSLVPKIMEAVMPSMLQGEVPSIVQREPYTVPHMIPEKGKVPILVPTMHVPVIAGWIDAKKIGHSVPELVESIVKKSKEWIDNKKERISADVKKDSKGEPVVEKKQR